MYRRPKFLEILIQIRESMARDADFDLDLFAEQLRNGNAAVGKRPMTENKDKDLNDTDRSPKLRKRRTTSKLRA